MRGALPGEPVECIGYESWKWTIWGGIAYFAERMYREVSFSLSDRTRKLIYNLRRFERDELRRSLAYSCTPRERWKSGSTNRR